MSDNDTQRKPLRPKLVIFDLDYTLWPFSVDTHVQPPFKKKGDVILDSRKKQVKCYPESTRVLRQLHLTGFELGIAACATERERAVELLELFGWLNWIKYIEIYPGSKIKHFRNLREKSQLLYQDMLFFDDELENISETTKMGILSTHVGKAGVTMRLLGRSFDEYDGSFPEPSTSKNVPKAK